MSCDALSLTITNLRNYCLKPSVQLDTIDMLPLLLPPEACGSRNAKMLQETDALTVVKGRVNEIVVAA